MYEEYVAKKIEEMAKKLPKFSDGRINYRNSDYAPVVNVFIRANCKLLVLKRSSKVGNYKGKWNCVSGYLDSAGPLKQKAMEEVKEELAITIDENMIKQGEPYEIFDEKIKKTWLVCPFLVDLKIEPEIKLDFENTEYMWIDLEELKSLDTVIGLQTSYSHCLALDQ